MRVSRALSPMPFLAWMDAVGPSLSARPRPTALSRCILHVAVVDHRWRDQIDAARALILRRLNARLGAGTVRGFQFGPLAEAPPGGHAPRRPGDAPSGTERQQFAGAVSGEVSEAFARAAHAARRRQRV